MYDSPHDLAIAHAHARAVRRRLCVFGACFVVAASLSLTYNFSRPPVYRSEASLLVTPREPGSSRRPAGEPAGSADVSTVAMQRHVLSHPSVIAEVWQRFSDEVEPDPEHPIKASDLHAMLESTVVPETNVIELSAEGPRAEDLPVLVSNWVDVCLARHDTAEETSSRSASEAAREQLGEFEKRIEQMRGKLADFRSEHDIASMQREENRVLTRLKGLTESLNKAEAEEVAAEARVGALKAALARGEQVGLEEDRQELSTMEGQLRELQGLLQGLESYFAQEYLERDRDVAKLKQQVKLLEQQIETKRARMGQAALSQAEIELETARNAVMRIEEQLAEHERMASNFTTRFAEHEALVEDLARLEELYRDLQERVVQVEVIREALPPELSVVQPASAADHPVRPAYGRDAAIGLAGSLLLGVIAVIVDWLITRPPRAAGLSEGRTVFYPWPQIESLAQARAGEMASMPAPPARVLEHRPPRELAPAELADLLRASDRVTRSVLGGLLSGLTVDEACALRWTHVDLDEGVIRVPGENARTLHVSPAVAALLAELEPAQADPAAPVWPNSHGGHLTAGAINSMIVSAAHVASLDRPGELDAEALRQTQVAIVLQQGGPDGQLPKIIDHILAEKRESQAVGEGGRQEGAESAPEV